MADRAMSLPGLATLKQLEGFRGKAYQDAGGLLTIGYGHLLTRSELSSGKVWIRGELVKWPNGITQDQAGALLRQDLREAEAAIVRYVIPTLSECQFDALVSFTFNVGVAAFQASTLLRILNGRLYADVPAQMRRWVHCAGRVSEGLRNRREAEVRLWLGTHEHA